VRVGRMSKLWRDRWPHQCSVNSSFNRSSGLTRHRQRTTSAVTVDTAWRRTSLNVHSVALTRLRPTTWS